MTKFNVELIKDPECFEENRIAAHSDHEFYRNMTELKQKESSFRKSLNGVWKFHYARNYNSTIPDFEKETYDCSGWEDIRVPSNIQMEGYDIPQYVNVQYPWEGHEEITPGQIPEKFNPVASYVTYFDVPDEMRGERIFLSFQGVESGVVVWLNGKFIGYSEDGYTPAEFELTDVVKEHGNKLAVQVFKWTSGSWCEDQDFFRFSGIFREVFLYAVPEVHVEDLKICATPGESLEEADFEISLKMSDCGTVLFSLEKEGKRIFHEKKTVDEPEVVNHFSWKVQKPLLWSAEKPDLYQLLIEVYNKEGKIQEIVPYKVGFRRFELKNGIMTLNGKRIVFKGVNRHEFSSVNGRCVSEEELRKDLATIKKNNINAIRTCHYPNQSILYTLCDEYGIYLIDETNLETHGTWDKTLESEDKNGIVPNDKPEWLPMVLDRANSMYQRDKNHPSVLIWSCGNESYGGKDIFEMSQFFRKNDPTRLVHYEGINNDRRYNGTSDMESQMYTSVEKIKEFLAKDDSKPFICCEYAHAMGNSCGAMHKYTELADEEPKYQGGFIWDYIDQSISKKDRYGKEFQAYGGDFGDRPTDYNFSGNGIVYGKDRSESPKMQEVKYNYQNITAEISSENILIRNKNLFLNTDNFECRITVARNGKEIKSSILETEVKPLKEKTYKLPFEKEVLPGEYTITASFHLKKDMVWAKAGYEIAFGQYSYTVASVHKTCSKPVKVIHSAHNIGVQGEHFEVLFSELNGGLVSYKYAGKELLKAIPKPNFWRAPTDNDCGNLMPYRYAQWKIASLYIGHKKPGETSIPIVEEKDGMVEITFCYYMPTIPESECIVKYQVSGDGTVRTILEYDPIKELGDMPEFGMIFKFDADYNQVEWYGLGGQETYADRKKGAKLGIYKNKVADNIAQYLVPQECGAKEEVRWAKVTDMRGRGILFEMTEVNGPMMFSALPYTPHEMEYAMHPYELPEVHYTVVRVAKQQMGIGGDDSWGALTHPEYLIPINRKMVFSFKFRGV